MHIKENFRITRIVDRKLLFIYLFEFEVGKNVFKFGLRFKI